MGHVVKVRTVAVGEERVQPPNALPPEAELYQRHQLIEPRFAPVDLCERYEESSSLRPNIEAYSTNIDGFEHRLEPVFDVDSEKAKQVVRDSLLLECIMDGRAPIVTEEQVGAELNLAKAVMAAERLMVEAFFKSCAGSLSFKQLRERTRIDLEVTGNAYWEVMRNQSMRPAQIELVPSHMMRLTELEGDRIEVKEPRRVSDIRIGRVAVKKRFRRFAQVIDGTEVVWFKEYGDPRVLSSKTGRFYERAEDLVAQEGTTPPATEIVHHKIYSPLTAYGVPRWIGAEAAVVGSFESEQINVAYFRDKCIPPLAIFIEDGQLEAGAVKRIEDILRNKVRGRANFHRPLILEATPVVTSDGNGGMRAGTPKIHLQPLTQMQQQDALFQQYEQNNAEKVGQQFRLPRLLRGQMTDFNRATADAAIEYAEQQVFQPVRFDFDHMIDQLFMVQLDVKFWRFKSGAPVVRSPPQLAEMVANLTKESVLLPREAREIAADIFGRPFEALPDEWVSRPTAQLRGGETTQAVKELVTLRAQLEASEAEDAGRRYDVARKAYTEEPEVIQIEHDVFRSLVRPASA